jgi:hypothetical protein
MSITNREEFVGLGSDKLLSSLWTVESDRLLVLGFAHLLDIVEHLDLNAQYHRDEDPAALLRGR